MECLNRVFPNIVKHFKPADDIDEVFDAVGIYMYQNRLKRKIVKEDEEEPKNDKRFSQ
jgi:hypothetical protein